VASDAAAAPAAPGDSAALGSRVGTARGARWMRRNRTKARTTRMLISTALGEFNTEAAVSAPCSVKA
jgi:hypothetical protein